MIAILIGIGSIVLAGIAVFAVVRFADPDASEGD